MQDQHTGNMRDQAAMTRIKVWDLPTRLFHWTLVVLFALAWWTAEERMLNWHRIVGYGIFSLLVFRLVWGFCGSTSARFSSFLRGPGPVARYIGAGLLRRGAGPYPGHNPLGGWSVIAMLLLLILQVSLGFIAVDVDGMESGPFSYLVSFEAGRSAASLHKLGFDVLVAMTVLHILAILYYHLFHREKLLGAMILGKRAWAQIPPALQFVSPFVAASIFLLIVGLVWLLLEFYGRA